MDSHRSDRSWRIFRLFLGGGWLLRQSCQATWLLLVQKYGNPWSPPVDVADIMGFSLVWSPVRPQGRTPTRTRKCWASSLKHNAQALPDLTLWTPFGAMEHQHFHRWIHEKRSVFHSCVTLLEGSRRLLQKDMGSWMIMVSPTGSWRLRGTSGSSSLSTLFWRVSSICWVSSLTWRCDGHGGFVGDMNGGSPGWLDGLGKSPLKMDDFGVPVYAHFRKPPHGLGLISTSLQAAFVAAVPFAQAICRHSPGQKQQELDINVLHRNEPSKNIEKPCFFPLSDSLPTTHYAWDAMQSAWCTQQLTVFSGDLGVELYPIVYTHTCILIYNIIFDIILNDMYIYIYLFIYTSSNYIPWASHFFWPFVLDFSFHQVREEQTELSWAKDVHFYRLVNRSTVPGLSMEWRSLMLVDDVAEMMEGMTCPGGWTVGSTLLLIATVCCSQVMYIYI